MIKIIQLLLFLFIEYSFCSSEKPILELVSLTPKVENIKIVQSYPYSEGEKLNQEIKTQNNKYKEDNSNNIYTQAELKYIEEIKRISMEEFDRAYEEEKNNIPAIPATNVNKESSVENTTIIQPKIVKNVVEKPIIKKEENKPTYKKTQETIIHEKTHETPIEEIKKTVSTNPASYEKILIEIDSVTNTMQVKAKIDNHFEEIKKYKVSTAKKNIEKPFGDGKITQITFNPTWYPTQDTINSFKKKGIDLPTVVPPGSKFNYMGAAKINLTHEVNGKTTFRIHGTLDERTIGTNESSGCIRMKNAQVVELATLLNNFSHIRSLNDVNVVLK
jgi:L,D-transpeptidase YcfS